MISMKPLLVSLARNLLLPSMVVLASETSLNAQTFVRTILDSTAEPLGVEKAKEKEEIGRLMGVLPEPEDFEDTCNKVADDLRKGWLPVHWDSVRSSCFWQQRSLEVARTTRLSGTTDQGTASVELLSDLFWGLRVTVKTSVAASDSENDESEEEEDEAETNLQQVLASGGNLSIDATYPWYAQKSKKEKVKSLFTSSLKVGGILPMLGQDDQSTTVEGDDTNANVQLELLNAQTQIESFNGSINFIAFGRAGLIDGTKNFHTSISNDDGDAFAYGELGVGLRLSDLVWILGSWASYSSGSLPNDQFSITVSMGK